MIDLDRFKQVNDELGHGEVARLLSENLRASDTLARAADAVVARRLELGVSIGVATFDEHGLPGEKELLAAADRAMYVAKAGGGSGAMLASIESRP